MDLNPFVKAIYADIEKMDKKQLYTALNRTKKYDFIHVNNENILDEYYERKLYKTEIVNSYFNSNYNNGKIYIIIFDNDLLAAHSKI